MAVFWIIRSIKYASLKYGLYKGWNIKVNCKINILNKIIKFLKLKIFWAKTK